MQGWYAEQMKISRDLDGLMMLEHQFSGFVTQVEMRLNQINKYMGRNLVELDALYRLRDIDVFSENLVKNIRELDDACYKLVEHIEISCDSYLVNKGFSIYKNDLNMLTSVFLGSAVAYFYFSIVGLLY